MLHQGHILVVDDNPINRMLLTRTLTNQGHTVAAVENGQQALNTLRNQPLPSIDVVLLDVVMPVLDGYQTLAQIKQIDSLRHIPVIMITAVDELDSAIRCIELGATDYLPKPFNPALLGARIGASLANKRLRDLELEYLEQVGHVTAAAAAVETATFDIASLHTVAARPDALGQLARVFQHMALEVRAREQRLEQQVIELRIEIDQVRQAKKVADITDSAYFQRLRQQAGHLRRELQGPNQQTDDGT